MNESEVQALRAELAECRAQLQVFREASEAAELRIVELRAELERVQGLLPQTCRAGTDDGDLVLAINRALRRGIPWSARRRRELVLAINRAVRRGIP